MSGRDYANQNSDQPCEEECFDFMWPRISNTTVDDNVFNSGSTQEYTSNFKESIERRERSSVDVQILENGNSVSTRLSSKGHDMVDISVVHVSRIFDRFRNMGSNTLGSDFMSQAADDNLFNDGSIQEDIPISEENVGKHETPSTDVQILRNGRNVSTRLSTGGHDVVPTTTMLVLRIFDHFRNMRLNSVGSDYMSHADNQNRTGDQQIRTRTLENADSNVHKRGCLHTVSTTSSLEESVQPEMIRARDIIGHASSSSRMAPVNHAYLCMDVTDCIIRPEIINFPNSSAKNVYQSHVQGEYSDSTHCRILHNEGDTTSYIDLGQTCDNKCRVTFSEHDSEITKDGKVIGRGIRKKGLYVMKLGNKPKDKICLAMIDENSTLWHRRLGHANMRLIQLLASKELVRNLPKLKFDQHLCDA
ncbi:retrovirus-related pol polyprotein from transposon TNT 1-94 [Tanacetum coccineum]|uniref:Retrovirus-related pol polyprotein from transposon TNT 1-94 n=1 Tax=Tanacetum coccineum TaxID=301880 RepID=A0ABQ4YLU5_9ASTR